MLTCGERDGAAAAARVLVIKEKVRPVKEPEWEGPAKHGSACPGNSACEALTLKSC